MPANQPNSDFQTLNPAPSLPKSIDSHQPVPANRSVTSRVNREEVLRLLFPGQDDGHADEQITQPIDLSEAITAVAAENIGLQSLEFLVFPLNGQLEFCLSPRTSDTLSTAMRQGQHVSDGQLRLDQLSTTGISPPSDEHDAPSRAISHLANKLKAADAAAIPDALGYEARSLSFADLGPPVRTDRLAVVDSPSYPVVSDLQFAPDDELFASLLDNAVPFIFEAIVGFESGQHYDYTLSSRLAVFKEGYGISSTKDWVKTAQHGSQPTLSDYYAHPNLVSSLNVDLEEYYTIDLDNTGSEVLSRREYTPIEQAQAAHKLVRGYDEFALLFHRAHNAGNAYEELGLNAKLPITANLLPLFCTGYHVEYGYPLWDGTRTWNSPTFGTGTLLEPAPGTTSDLAGTTTTVHPEGDGDDARSPIQSSESDSSEPTLADLSAHARLAVRMARRLMSSGWEVTILDADIVAELREANILTEYLADTDGSVTDIRATKDDADPLAVEISADGSTKPANVLINAMRAEYNDEELLFFAEDKATARRIAKILDRPWNTEVAVEEGIPLYTMKLPEYRIDTDAGFPVVPTPDAAADWRLFPDGQLELWYDGPTTIDDASAAPDRDTNADHGVVAEGAVTDHPRSFAYDLPLATANGDSYTVVDSTGTEKTYSDDAFAEEYTAVPAPCPPSRLEWLSPVEIRYPEGDDTKTFMLTKSWNVDSKTTRYEKSIKTFLETFTTVVDEEELYVDRASEYYWQWFEARSNKKEPNKRYYGIGTPEHIETKRRNNNSLYRDRTWIYPRGIVSPVFPFVE